VTHTTRRWHGIPYRLIPIWAVFAALLYAGYALPAPIHPTAAPQDEVQQKALAAEKSGDWIEACRRYDEMIRQNRNDLEAREAYHRCIRQYQIARRHSDRLYRETLARLTSADALDIYEAVLAAISKNYVDNTKIDLTTLFKHGVQELRYALNQEVFMREHLRKDVSPGEVAVFKTRLADWPERKVGKSCEVRDLIMSLAGQAKKEGLVEDKGQFIVVLALEFAFGACTGLDDYSLFLTPQHFTAVQAILSGEFVGVGIDLVPVGDELEITRIYPNSPVANVMDALPIQVHDRITQINKQSIAGMRPEDAVDLLRGEPHSTVELTVYTPGQMSRSYKLERRFVQIPSVEFSPVDDESVGYLRITHFQKTTVQDVRDALAQLQGGTRELKGLILDLRGNPGGSFDAAREIAELFLPEGAVILNTTSQLKQFKDKEYRVRPGGNPLTVPLCVLVDYETASSAEILAGALKDNLKDSGRLSLVGQPTFGKGAIQKIIPLDNSKTPPGIRLTVAQFTSPRKYPYASVGVTPDELILEPKGDIPRDPARDRAKEVLKRLMMGMS
jgi:carboxyl-terminal processing protease